MGDVGVPPLGMERDWPQKDAPTPRVLPCQIWSFWVKWRERKLWRSAGKLALASSLRSSELTLINRPPMTSY